MSLLDPDMIYGRIVAMVHEPVEVWIIQGQFPSEQHPRLFVTKDEPMFFTNNTDPDGDEVLVGHHITIVPSLLIEIPITTLVSSA